jgi:hypothetical protein
MAPPDPRSSSGIEFFRILMNPPKRQTMTDEEANQFHRNLFKQWYDEDYAPTKKEEPMTDDDRMLENVIDSAVETAKKHIDNHLCKKKIYISPKGVECKILRETNETVTLLIYDNPNDPHEWTMTKEKFLKKYKEKT